MRWFRTFTLILLLLFFLLVVAPAIRWFQTRKTFVPAGPPADELVFAAASAPKWTLLPRIVSESNFDRFDPIGEYLAGQALIARMEPYRIPGTGLYDLRPYLSDKGMAFSPEAVATWDPDSETALLKLPAADLEEARILVGANFDEWKSLQIEIRASMVAVDWEDAANFLSEDQNLTIEWLAKLPPESVRILHSISTFARSGQRAKATSGSKDRRNPTATDRFVEFELDPVLGSDRRLIDINFSYHYRLADDEASGKPKEFRVVTQVAVVAGHAMVLELGTSQDPNRDSLVAHYLVLEANVVSMLGNRTKRPSSP